MGGLYDILEAYRQQNDPRFIYEGLYEEPAYTGPNIDPMYNLGARQFGNMNRMDFGVPQQATGIMQQAPLQNLGIDTSYGVANEEDVEQEFLPDQKKSSGLADLFRTLIGFAVPGAGLLMNLGRDGMGGIKSLNQRIQQSDFGRSKTLADYFATKRNKRFTGQDDPQGGPITTFRNVKQQAQDKIDDRGRGNRPGGANYSAPSRPSRASSYRDSSSFGKSFHGG
jgi:hypothetical protein